MNTKHLKSFTLIELLVSISILGIVIMLTGGILLSVVKNYNKQATLSKIQRSGDYVSDFLEGKLLS